MNEHAKEVIEAIQEALNAIPHQQVSPEVLILMIRATEAATILKVKFDK